MSLSQFKFVNYLNIILHVKIKINKKLMIGVKNNYISRKKFRRNKKTFRRNKKTIRTTFIKK